MGGSWVQHWHQCRGCQGGFGGFDICLVGGGGGSISLKKKHTTSQKTTRKQMGVEPKIGEKPTKMDKLYFMENPMNKWMIWGFSHIFGLTPRYGI